MDVEAASPHELQQRLRQPVCAECQSDRMAIAPRQILGIDRKNRKNKEHPEHSQAINAGQAETGPQFQVGHPFRGKHAGLFWFVGKSNPFCVY